MSEDYYTIVMKAIDAWLNEIKYLNYMLDEVDKHTLDHAAEQAQIKMHNEGDCADFCIVCETQGANSLPQVLREASK